MSNITNKPNKILRQLKADRQVIIRNYLTPSHPTAFSSPENIKRFYGNKFSRDNIAKALSSIDAYTIHREFKKPKYRNPVYIYKLREHVQMDLMDMSRYAEDNEGVTFIMVAIDSFSKKAWVKPMVTKSAKMSLKRIKELVEEIQPKIKALFLDRGTEFRNKHVKAYLREKNIKMIHPYSETKAAIAERFNRTLKDLIFKYKAAYQTTKYIDVLDDLVSTYNNRIHTTLKILTPNEAEKEENRSKVLCALNDYYLKAVGGTKKRKPKYKVGQMVRIQVADYMMRRGWHPRFKQEHFEIIKVNTRMPIPMYNLRSLNDFEVIRGGFYANELSPLSGNVFKIEKILKEETKRGRKRLYVKWLGYDERHNSWIDETDVTQDFDNE